MTIEVIIPFSGLYNTMHESAIDNNIELETEHNIDEDALDYDNIDFGLVNANYCQKFAENFFAEFNLKATVKKIVLSKDYFTHNDNIFAELDKEQALIVYNKVMKGEYIRQLVYDALKPRNGFIPYYSNNIDDGAWLFDSLEPIQWQLILEAYVLEEYSEFIDYEDRVAEDLSCNGVISALLWQYHDKAE